MKSVIIDVLMLITEGYCKFNRYHQTNSAPKKKKTFSNIVGLLFFVCLVGVFFMPKSIPDWNAKLSIRDHALIFSNSHYKELESQLKKLWVEYKTPTYVITDLEENYSQHIKTIPSLLRSTVSGYKVILILKNSNNYSLLGFSLSPSLRKYQPPTLRSYLLGSFTSIQETYMGVLALINKYQQQVESERKVKGDFFNTIPAILSICLLISICGLLYFLGRWLYRKYLIV